MSTRLTIAFLNFFTQGTVPNGVMVNFYPATGVMNGTTLIDTQSALNGTITTNNLLLDTTYRVLMTGTGAPSGTFLLYTSNPSGPNTLTHVSDTSSTTPPTAVVSNVNYNVFLTPVTIEFFHFANGTFIANNITVTIKTTSGTTVDTQVTNNGMVKSSLLSILTTYNITFTGTGAPTGTHTLTTYDHSQKNIYRFNCKHLI